jgi:hypothetical protein
VLYVRSRTPDDGRKDRPKHVQSQIKTNKFEKLVHLVGFTIAINIRMHGPMNVIFLAHVDCDVSVGCALSVFAAPETCCWPYSLLSGTF